MVRQTSNFFIMSNLYNISHKIRNFLQLANILKTKIQSLSSHGKLNNLNNHRYMKKTLILSALAVVLAACCQTEKATINVVPYPNSVDVKYGEFNAAGADFHYDAKMNDASKAIVENFAAQLTLTSGQPSVVSEGSANSGFVFKVNNAIPAEAYKIRVSRKAVRVEASDLNGFNYAVQTIKQMLPVEIFGNVVVEKEWTLPCVVIKDAPRFAYRGMHLDVSRHFYNIEQVKRYLDVMEMHKLNTFHWHLTDDQGWRLESKKYPELTTVGSVRKGTVVKKNWDVCDNIPYGGYYTQDEVREIVAYAAAKGITVIPEIDLPGHMLAALTAFPHLGCTGGPYELWYRWGVSDDVLCVGKEETFEFIENVLEEVLELFPSKYIHIGGDECPKVRWEKCPTCQAKMKELGIQGDENHPAEHYLQSYAISRVEKFLNERGRSIIGWDEILEGGLAPNATVMSWRGSAGGEEAVKQGHDAIMVPNTHFYFDYYQSLDVDNEPFGIGGYLPVDVVYSYEPYTENMNEEERAHILGVQANVWTEYIKTEDHLHYMLLPRMTALSEVQWCQPENKSWDRFTHSIPQVTTIYDILGYNYAKHIFDLTYSVKNNNETQCLEVAFSIVDDAPIRYTLDGSEPTMESLVYDGPIQIKESCTLKAKVFREDIDTKVLVKKFDIHKAFGRPITMNTEAVEKYKFGAPASFTDGLRGEISFAGGAWTGFKGTPMEVVIEMDGETTYSSVTASALIDKGSHILNPISLSVAVSEDGNEFQEVANVNYPVETAADPDGMKEYTVTFPETAAKFLKVNVGCVTSLPAWVGNPEYQGFIFIDEVLVK